MPLSSLIVHHAYFHTLLSDRMHRWRPGYSAFPFSPIHPRPTQILDPSIMGFEHVMFFLVRDCIELDKGRHGYGHG